MNGELIGPILIIVIVLLLAVLFAWQTRRKQKERWGRMANEVNERRYRDSTNAEQVRQAKR